MQVQSEQGIRKNTRPETLERACLVRVCESKALNPTLDRLYPKTLTRF